MLDCDLVKGKVVVGVRPALPIESVHFILGNGLASSRVRADTPPLPVITPCPVGSESPETLPEVSSNCVVTRAKLSPNQSTLISSFDVTLGVPSLSDIPISLSHNEVMKEQCEDPSLKKLFERILPVSEIASAASGYFLCNDLLFRKWVPVGEDAVKVDIFQLVFPSKICPLVLKVAHDQCGHFGVRKTYLGILKHFFGHVSSVMYPFT